ncbi:MAG: AAA family ATPase, partial [Bacteroidia bacterium]
TGLNGMGKSSLIQVLLMLRQSYSEGYLRDEHNPELILNGSFVQLGQVRHIYNRYAIDEEITIELTGCHSNNEFKASYFWYFFANTDNTNGVVWLRQKPQYFHAKDYLLDFFEKSLIYISAERVSPEISFPATSIENIKEKKLGNKGQYAFHYLDMNKDDVIYKNIKHSNTLEDDFSLYNNVNAWLGEISPGVKIQTELFDKLSTVSLGFRFDTGRENIWTDEFRSAHVGFGLTYIAPIIIALLAAKEGEMLIIENPEAHLHPKGQAQMGKLLSLVAQNDVQIIIETHSDHILNGIRLAAKHKDIEADKVAIHFFHRENEQPEHSTTVTQIRLYENGKMDKFPNGFFDEWGKAMYQLTK